MLLAGVRRRECTAMEQHWAHCALRSSRGTPVTPAWPHGPIVRLRFLLFQCELPRCCVSGRCPHLCEPKKRSGPSRRTPKASYAPRRDKTGQHRCCTLFGAGSISTAGRYDYLSVPEILFLSERRADTGSVPSLPQFRYDVCRVGNESKCEIAHKNS